MQYNKQHNFDNYVNGNRKDCMSAIRLGCEDRPATKKRRVRDLLAMLEPRDRPLFLQVYKATDPGIYCFVS